MANGGRPGRSGRGGDDGPGLVTGLVTGVLSGFVAWLISLVYRNLYAEGLVSELTTFAAFTALVVFIPAVAAVAIGRWLVDRKRPPFVRRRITDDQTDVFDAVRDDDAKTGPIPGLAGGSAAAAEEHTSAVATAERDDEDRKS